MRPPSTASPTRQQTNAPHGPGADDSVEQPHQQRFLLFSQPRSASSSFVNLLNAHPQVLCEAEVLSDSWDADGQAWKRDLGFRKKGDIMRRLPSFMASFWASACGFRPIGPSSRAVQRLRRRKRRPSACGFKVFQRHFRWMPPAANLSRLLRGAPPGSVRVIVLERRNVSAEFGSWRRAMTSGNWGITPGAQRDAAAVGFRNPARAANTTFAQFARMHRAWFQKARELVPRPLLLHLWAEDLTRDNVSLLDATARALAFLRVAQGPEMSTYADAFARG
tara:strand:+ start:654 stop:1487 length:834 start_codon:yes stop_codon:yes gene_type:complete